MLKFATETLEGLPEALHEYYEQGDNGFTLKVDGAVSKAQFDQVNQKAVDNATEAQRRRKTVERITSRLGIEDAAGIDAVLDDLLSRKSGGKTDEAHQAVIDQMKAAHKTELDGLNGQLAKIRGDAAREQLKVGLMGVGFGDKVADMLAQTSMSRVKFDDNGQMRIMQADQNSPLAGSGADGFATTADLSKELAAAMPELLTDAGKGGGGKPPASGAQGQSKQMSREQWRGLDTKARSDFFKSGGTLKD